MKSFYLAEMEIRFFFFFFFRGMYRALHAQLYLASSRSFKLLAIRQPAPPLAGSGFHSGEVKQQESQHHSVVWVGRDL